jgi:hypothetical protein
MSYATMEADIDHGRVIPAQPEKLPVVGRALLTVLEPAPKPNLDKIKTLLGTFRPSIDLGEWQEKIRGEWDQR